MTFKYRLTPVCLILLALMSAGRAGASVVVRPDAVKPQYDVVIAGAGTGGFGAAVQAARMGASVLLLEETDWIGGQANAAAVTSMDEGRPIVRERGLYHEFVDRIKGYYQPLGLSVGTCYWSAKSVCFEPRVGQKIMYDMLADARGAGTLDVCLRSTVVKVVKSADRVTGVEVETVAPEGQQTKAVACKVLVDATEWGDVIPLTGARYRVGNCTSDRIDPSKMVQDATWTAVIKRYPQGVPADLSMPKPPPGYTEAIRKRFEKELADGTAISSKAKPWTFATFLGYRGMPNSAQSDHPKGITRTQMNADNDYPVFVSDVEDPAKRWDTSKRMRLRTLQLLYYIRTELGKTDWAVADDEGYDTPFNRDQADRWIREQPEMAPFRPLLVQMPVMAYARESRRIIGLHTLTSGEINRVHGPTPFVSAIALADYPVDIHGSHKREYLETDLDDPNALPHKWGDGGIGPFPIPFECFIPEKIDGFLPAEKNFSQSRVTNGATRLQPSTMLMGQAVGAIAALAVKHDLQPRQLNPVLVQKVLLEAGDTLYFGPLKDVPRSDPNWKSIQLVLVHKLLTAPEGQFSPAAPLQAKFLPAVVSRLVGVPFKSDAVTGPVTRTSLLKAIDACMQKSGRKFGFTPPGADEQPQQPLTRSEAASILASFLEQSAASRL